VLEIVGEKLAAALTKARVVEFATVPWGRHRLDSARLPGRVSDRLRAWIEQLEGWRKFRKYRSARSMPSETMQFIKK